MLQSIDSLVSSCTHVEWLASASGDASESFSKFCRIILCSFAASAAIYTYTLHYRPDGNHRANYDYRLRQYGPGLFYTFRNGNAVLTYDDAALTASITGFVNQLTPVDRTSPINTSILFDITSITDAGGGFFSATGGNGKAGGWR